MNAPHVVALIYRVKHKHSVNYAKARGLVHETATFIVRVENGEARFEMKEHFASVEAAREAVAPFIREWEVSAALERGPGEFELIFEDADVVDRDPRPGVVLIAATGRAVATGQAVSVVVGRNRYPELPNGMVVTAEVEAMLAQVRALSGLTPISGVLG